MSDLTPPKNFKQAMEVAYARLLGASVAEAAQKVGVTESQVRIWERKKWWGLAQERARQRWLGTLTGKSRVGLEAAVEKDGKLALQVLERLDPALAPAPQALEIRALMARLDVDKLPDWAVDRLANGESPVGVLMGLSADERKAAGLLEQPKVMDADFEVEDDA